MKRLLKFIGENDVALSKLAASLVMIGVVWSVDWRIGCGLAAVIIYADATIAGRSKGGS